MKLTADEAKALPGKRRIASPLTPTEQLARAEFAARITPPICAHGQRRRHLHLYAKWATFRHKRVAMFVGCRRTQRARRFRERTITHRRGGV
jgi:hypothetical protein